MQQTVTSSNQQQKSQLDEILHETELGEFFLKYKTALLVSFCVGAFLLIGFGIYNYWHGQKVQEWSGQIYQFRSNTFKSYTDKKIDADEFKKQFEIMANKMKGDKILLLPLIESSDQLVKNGNKELALGLLQTYGDSGIKNGAISEYFVRSRSATLLEDLGKNKEAITQLEKLLSSSMKIMEAKTVLDLGRLYLISGDTQKALAQFQYVIDNTAQADLVKLARLYKGQIPQK